MTPVDESQSSAKADAALPRFISALTTGATVEEAAKECGVSKSTGHRWMRLPEFKEALKDAKRDLIDALGQSMAHKARDMAEVLYGIAQDADEDGRARVQAARTFFEFALKFRAQALEDLFETKVLAMEQRLAELEREAKHES